MTTIKNSDEILVELDKSRNKYRTIVQAGIAKWVKDFQEGKIKIETVDDLKKLVELDINIQTDDYVMSKNTKPRR
ncbi:hypothetical protein [Paenibacillus harenae]|uniref:Uncharacterized protein YbcV (DUF1398 family) n=1 Tax=Paenibacillus harenae TaxID=306543 RepID=A0ABT9U549_PAEHA|nr:hypothetical protein [Paenibacillus harenae]MDQ0114372.1 uncharacterized protein YbcV (DUF1398 family) [Paenibacillus harenae]